MYLYLKVKHMSPMQSLNPCVIMVYGFWMLMVCGICLSLKRHIMAMSDSE